MAILKLEVFHVFFPRCAQFDSVPCRIGATGGALWHDLEDRSAAQDTQRNWTDSSQAAAGPGATASLERRL